MKHKAPQKEMTWADEPFALIREQATDFTSVLERENQRARDRAKQDSKQLQAFACEHSNCGWINASRGRVRCLDCGFQYDLNELPINDSRTIWPAQK